MTRRSAGWLAALVLWGAWATTVGSQDAAARQEPTEPASGTTPNVVIILADDLGWGDIGAMYPDSALPTPRIDSIAAEGMRFTDAHSPSSVCTPTRYGLLTGRYAWRTRLTRDVLNGYSLPLLEPDRSTLGTLLRGQGYRTAVVGKWHLGMEMPRRGTTRFQGDPGIDFGGTITDSPIHHGFDEYFGISGSLDMPPYVYIRNDRFTALPTIQQPSRARPHFMRAGPRAEDFVIDEVLDDLVEEAVAFIERSSRDPEPFFLYFALTAPHSPTLPHERFRGRTGLGEYGDFVAQVDDAVGLVLDALDRVGVSDETLVIFTSDNGSYMFSREDTETDHVDDPVVMAYRVGRHRSNAAWRGTKADIWEGGHRVPFLVRWPGIVEPGAESAATIAHTDLYATLAEIVGVESGRNAAEDSVSLLPILRGESATRVPLVHHSQRGMFALRDGKWKLVAGDGSGGRQRPLGRPFRRPFQLFDLSLDPTETLDVAADYPDVVQRLESTLQIFRSGGRSVGLPGNGSPEKVGTLPPLSLPMGDGARLVEISRAFRDPDGDSLTYRVESSPPSVARVSLSGSTVSVTPMSPGTATVVATATDPSGSNTTAEQRFTVTVPNRSPMAVGNLPALALTVEEGSTTVMVSGAFSDPDGDALTYEASSSSASVATVSVSGSTLTVTPVAPGEATATVTATDVAGSNTSASQSFVVTVGVDYDVDDDGRIEIRTPSQLDAVRHDLDADGAATEAGAAAYGSAFPDAFPRGGCPSWGCTGYELASDLDLDTNGNGIADAGDAYWHGGAGWMPIGGQGEGFAATFAGNGHVIRGLFVDRAAAVGLFATTSASSVIHGVGLVGVDVRGETQVGGLVGVNRGTVRWSYATGAASGSVAGGLVGENHGTVAASYSTAVVTGGDEAGGLVGSARSGSVVATYATGRVSGTQGVGGLVGSLSGGALTGSYATGRVTGTSDVGGLVGSLSGGTLTSSYWDTETTGHETGSAGRGLPTSALQASDWYSTDDLGSWWNLDVDGDGGGDLPWLFGGTAGYLALWPRNAGWSDWVEFGHQVRSGPSVTATVDADGVAVSWTAVDVSHWRPAPPVTYAVYRTSAAGVERVATGLTERTYADTALSAGTTYAYQVAAEVWGGEPARSRRTEATAVTTPLPAVGIAAGTSSVTEGMAVDFRLTRTGAATEALAVAVSVAETGSMLAASPPLSVTFGAGASSVTLGAATVDDAVVERDSVVTAAISGGAGYAAAAGAGSAAVAVEDNDEAQFAVSADPLEIEEGESATVTVSITNEVTFAEDRAITLEFAGTATRGVDYTVSPAALTLEAGSGSASVTLAAAEDDRQEDAETAVVTATRDGVAIGAATLTIAADTETGAGARPNILFLFTDDQRRDTIGAWGNSRIETPAIDRLADEGFSFRNAYNFGANFAAVCAPSRAMLMTGRSWIRSPSPIEMDGLTTLPEQLTEAGYRTFLTGKWHGNQSPAMLRSFDSGTAVMVGAMSDHDAVRIQDLENGRLVRGRDGLQFSSELFADAAIGFLDAQAASDEPFFAFVSFTAPHDPRDPPLAYRQKYYRAELPLPVNFLPQHPFDIGTLTVRGEHLDAWPRRPEAIRDQLAEYYGLITHLDDQVARILDALEANGQADNTIVVYASDNGLDLGGHGLLAKGSLYEDATGVPLIIKGPGIPHGSTDAFAYLYDLFPTLLRVGGAEAPSGIDGSDLSVLWSEDAAQASWRESLFLAYRNRIRAVRDERFKLIVYPRINHRQLFDLAEDPHEVDNLANLPEHAATVARLGELLQEWRTAQGDQAPLEVTNPSPLHTDLTGRDRQLDGFQPSWIVNKYLEPQVTRVERHDPRERTTAADTLTWRIRFRREVTEVDGADFGLGGDGVGTPTFTVTAVADGRREYDVTASGGNLAGLADVTVTLEFSDAYSIRDLDGGNVPRSWPSDAQRTYTVSQPAGPANRGPRTEGTLPRLSLRVADGAASLAVSGAFVDPDGDALTYEASSSSASVATVSVSGSTLTVTPVAPGEATATVTATDVAGSNTSASQSFVVTVGVDYDVDDDGRIEIRTPSQLDAVRHDLDADGAATEAGAAAYGSAFPDAFPRRGCPSWGCTGYELASDLDLDTNGNGIADAGDAYWHGGAGWMPIGGQGEGFAATFAGNGHVIRGLFVDRAAAVGLFATTSASSVIHGVGLVGVDVRGETQVGGLVGVNRGTVRWSYATGAASGSVAGGLVGENHGTVAASYSTAVVTGGDEAGGLVGSARSGSVVATYATGRVSGTQGVGGLVGSLSGGALTGSYATGRVTGTSDVGGLVGSLSGGTLTSSYWDTETTGHETGSAGRGLPTSALQASDWYSTDDLGSWWNLDVDGDGGGDLPWLFGGTAGYLALWPRNAGWSDWVEFGHQVRSGPSVTATVDADGVAVSWTAVDVSHWRPAPPVTYAVYRTSAAGVERVATGLTERTYADTALSAGTTYAYQVAAEVWGGEPARSRRTEATAATTPLPVNDSPVSAGSLAALTLAVADGAATVEVGGAFSDPDGDALTFGAASSAPAVATVTVSGSTVTVTPVSAGASTVTVTATDVDGSNTSASQSFTVTVPATDVDYDADDDGLIEIRSLAQLDAVRHDLDGDGVATRRGATTYGAAFSDAAAEMGCPATGCTGYELTADLGFDTNGNGTADAGDAWWNRGSGWVPLGSASSPFTSTFWGNGHTVSHLFIRDAARDHVGLFGMSRGVVGGVGLVEVDVSGRSFVGGLVGKNEGGRVTASHTTGRVSGYSVVGGLVGWNAREIREHESGQPNHVSGTGVVTASYSTAQVSADFRVGGLVGLNWDRIAASYATGSVTAQITQAPWLESSAGGLVGMGWYGSVAASYATGGVSGPGRNVGGLTGNGPDDNEVTASYWDTESSGVSSGGAGSGRPTSALQEPMGYTGLYASWAVDVDGDGESDRPWDFGTSTDYPVLSLDVNGDGVATWREVGGQGRTETAAPASSSASSAGVATTRGVPRPAFTDDPLVAGTPVRAVQLLELRSRIDGLRRGLGLLGFSWTDATIVRGVTPARAVHLTDLRTALEAAYAAAGREAPVYTDAVVTAGVTALRAVHLQELRAAVVALEGAP